MRGVAVCLLGLLVAAVAASSAGSGPRGPRYVDLKVTLTGSTELLTVGNGVARFTVAVENRGPDAAPGVTVPVALPLGLRFVRSVGTRCRGRAPGVVCRFGRLETPRRRSRGLSGPPRPAHTPWAATETFEVRAVAPGVGSVDALALSARREANQADNRVSVPIVLHPGPPLAELGVRIEPSASRVEVGKEVRYRVTVTNDGPGEAMKVDLRYPPPDGLQFSSLRAAGFPFQFCTAHFMPVESEACILSIPPGGQLELTIGFRPRPVAVGEAAFAVELASPTPDPNPENNRASATTAIDPAPATADLGVTMSASPERVRVGDEVTYTIVVRNHGPDAAREVRLHSEGFGDQAALVSVEPKQGSCDARVVCSLGSISSGASTTVTLVVRVVDRRTPGLTRSATVLTESFDPSWFDVASALDHALVETTILA